MPQTRLLTKEEIDDGWRRLKEFSAALEMLIKKVSIYQRYPMPEHAKYLRRAGGRLIRAQFDLSGATFGAQKPPLPRALVRMLLGRSSIDQPRVSLTNAIEQFIERCDQSNNT